MSSSDVGAVVGAVQWGEEGSYVREVVSRGPLPQLAKVIKGQYLGVGVASLASPGLASTLLLLGTAPGVRVAAQCVKFKEGRRVVGVGPRLAIPDTFDGFFEILSEDGRAVRCMESVSELAKRFPDSALVRETLNAYVSRSDDVETITEKSRAVAAGETLVLVGEVTGSRGSSGGGGRSQHNRFLRCFDQAGQNVYLPFDARGKFSAIAKEDNISGVHSVRNLLNKRLPLMVRLVHGRPPLGAKATHFLPELRLFAALSEQPLAALPLGKDAPLVLLPPAAPLKLAHARNADHVEKTKEFLRLCERATAALTEVSDRIYVYDVTLGGKGGMRDPRFSHWPDQAKARHKHPHPRPTRTKSPPAASTKNGGSGSGTTPDDYDEIDQIYDYVRGFAPLPRHIRSPYASEVPAAPRRTQPPPPIPTNTRPTPPPIETIPSRRPEKLSPSVHPALISAALDRAACRRVEKRTRRASGHLHPVQDPGTPKTPTEARVAEGSKAGDNLSPKVVAEGGRVGGEGVRGGGEGVRGGGEGVRGGGEGGRAGGDSGRTPGGDNKVGGDTSKSSVLDPKVGGGEGTRPPGNKLFVKAAQQRSQKSRALRQKSASPVKECLEVVSVAGGGGGGGSPSPLFRLRYKSLTNLTLDCDTLDSSTSGGRGSGGSGGSGGSAAGKARPPEKRSRRLMRPRSLTDLAWGGRSAAPTPSRALLEAERRLRLEPGVYRHAPPTTRHTRPLASQKKIGTLYL